MPRNSTTKVCCLLRARKVKNCCRSEASRMSGLRYICGGDEGRSEVGSGGDGESRGVLPPLVRSEGDVWPAVLAAKLARLVFGGGAPFTTWSSLESAMAGTRDEYVGDAVTGAVRISWLTCWKERVQPKTFRGEETKKRKL